MSKKNTSILTVFYILAVILIIAFTVFKHVPFKTEFRYTPYDDGYMLSVYTQAFNDKTANITVPSQYKGKNVVAIDDKIFYRNDKITHVTIPDTVTKLGASVFKECKNLKSVTLSKNLKTIGGECFKDCKSLTAVVLPDSVTDLHGESFMGCSSLQSVKLSSRLTEIRGNMFENCTSLEVINIPDGVTRIAAHAFYGCSRLSDVTVPNSVTEIGSSAFRLCISLKEIILPKDVNVNERAFKESPTNVIYKKLTDEVYNQILEEVRGKQSFDALIIHKKGIPEDKITRIDGCLNLTDSEKFAELYPEYEVIKLPDEPDALKNYMLRAQEEGATGVKLHIYSEIGTNLTGEIIFISSDAISFEKALSFIQQ